MRQPTPQKTNIASFLLYVDASLQAFKMFAAIQITRKGPQGRKGSPIERKIGYKDVERKMESKNRRI